MQNFGEAVNLASSRYEDIKSGKLLDKSEKGMRNTQPPVEEKNEMPKGGKLPSPEGKISPFRPQ